MRLPTAETDLNGVGAGDAVFKDRYWWKYESRRGKLVTLSRRVDDGKKITRGYRVNTRVRVVANGKVV